MKKPALVTGVGLGPAAFALIGVLVLFIAAVANGAAGHQKDQGAAGSQISMQGGQVGDIPRRC
ncbi:hypothetical protein AB0G85_32945 [Streptomyces sioyaensis]|uniref:hypothetical protein n=1 Tax=Streptomyces sioyaensis TaxID=67364 RepID=UPI0033CF64E0